MQRRNHNHNIDDYHLIAQINNMQVPAPIVHCDESVAFDVVHRKSCNPQPSDGNVKKLAASNE
jgi:hypothetical protein